MAKSKAEKIALGEGMADRFSRANAAVTAEYRGISANDLARLRTELRKAKVEFHVVKNRLARKGIETKAQDSLELAPALRGPIGVAYLYGDVAAGAKALLAFEKEVELFKVGAGVMEGKALSVAELRSLSELPSREVLMARLVGTLVSPHRGLLTVLNGVSGKLVRVINAIKDTKA